MNGPGSLRNIVDAIGHDTCDIPEVIIPGIVIPGVIDLPGAVFYRISCNNTTPLVHVVVDSVLGNTRVLVASVLNPSIHDVGVTIDQSNSTHKVIAFRPIDNQVSVVYTRRFG